MKLDSKIITALQSICRFEGNLAVPSNVGEVSQLVKCCGEAGLTVGMNQNACVRVSNQEFKAIEGIESDSGVVTVQSGISVRELEFILKSENLQLPLNLGYFEDCSIGEIVLNGSCLVNSLKYGKMVRNLVGVEFVDSEGNIHSDLLGLSKNNTGYDFKSLIIGSQGKFGLVTRLMFQSFPIQPKQTKIKQINTLEEAKEAFLVQRTNENLLEFNILNQNNELALISTVEGQEDISPSYIRFNPLNEQTVPFSSLSLESEWLFKPDESKLISQTASSQQNKLDSYLQGVFNSKNTFIYIDLKNKLNKPKINITILGSSNLLFPSI